jgi:hypothetical protein
LGRRRNRNCAGRCHCRLSCVCSFLDKEYPACRSISQEAKEAALLRFDAGAGKGDLGKAEHMLSY